MNISSNFDHQISQKLLRIRMMGLVFTPPKLYSNEQILASEQQLMTVVGAWNKIGKLANVQYCENDVSF